MILVHWRGELFLPRRTASGYKSALGRRTAGRFPTMSFVQKNLLFVFVTLLSRAIAIADRKLLHQPLYPIDWTSPPSLPPPPPLRIPSEPAKISTRASGGANRSIFIAVSVAIVVVAVLCIFIFFSLKRRKRFARRGKDGSVLSPLSTAGAAVPSNLLYLGTFEPSSERESREVNGSSLGKLKTEHLSSSITGKRPDDRSSSNSLPIEGRENGLAPTQCDAKPMLLPPAVHADQDAPSSREFAVSEPPLRSARRQWSKPPPPPLSKGAPSSPLKSLSPLQQKDAPRPSPRRRWEKPTSPADIPIPLAETESDDRGEDDASDSQQEA